MIRVKEHSPLVVRLFNEMIKSVFLGFSYNSLLQKYIQFEYEEFRGNKNKTLYSMTTSLSMNLVEYMALCVRFVCFVCMYVKRI